jgi:hypothetical protein
MLRLPSLALVSILAGAPDAAAQSASPGRPPAGVGAQVGAQRWIPGARVRVTIASALTLDQIVRLARPELSATSFEPARDTIAVKELGHTVIVVPDSRSKPISRFHSQHASTST